jgi:hypothetical protein
MSSHYLTALFAVSASRGAGRRNAVGWRPALGEGCRERIEDLFSGSKCLTWGLGGAQECTWKCFQCIIIAKQCLREVWERPGACNR